MIREMERSYSSLPVSKNRKDGKGLFVRERTFRTRDNSFKLKKNRFVFKILHCEGDEALERVAQGSCGLFIPGSVQAQLAWSFGELNLIRGVPANGSWGWNYMIFIVPSDLTHSMILFYDSMNLGKILDYILSQEDQS